MGIFNSFWSALGAIVTLGLLVAVFVGVPEAVQVVTVLASAFIKIIVAVGVAITGGLFSGGATPEDAETAAAAATALAHTLAA